MSRRDELLARRAHLLPLYQNREPLGDLQHDEIATELARIGEELKALPREPAAKPARARRHHNWRDHRAAAAGRD